MKNQVIAEFVEKWKVKAIEWGYEVEKLCEENNLKLSAMHKNREINIFQKVDMEYSFAKGLGISQALLLAMRDRSIKDFFEREAKRKYKQFVKTITERVGEVEEAHLRIGIDGNINGYVKGTEGTANVNTILAGGYNIQCLHYRVLVK